MKSSWTKGKTPEQSKIIFADFIGSLGIRIRLEELLLDKVRLVNTLKRRKEGYDSPNWAYAQADIIGYERALFEVISLISDKVE